ncbi:MAG: ABC transporter substrate-binding protein [Trueperaceae bacterium]|nr:MAG: ABC transporter substrate-binding protein [Trueperaceae bacterium]
MMRTAAYIVAVTVVVLFAAPVAFAQGDTTTTHALDLVDEPKYGPGFSRFDYVNPDAPKGGRLNLAAIGTGFDNLHPFILKGVSAAGSGLVYDTLTTQPMDEFSAEYGLLAETIEVPADNSWVQFTLRPEARWHDGVPLTADDVVWSFEILTTQGHPFYGSYYGSVASAEAIDDHTVKFTFSGEPNRELPVIMGQLPILPKHYWEERDFTETTLEPPLGSGPYKIKELDPGRSITYERVEDYWGQDVPVNVGHYNIDILHYDYYRDTTVAIEAFKAGEYDFRSENISKEWATAYNIPALDQGLLIKEFIPHENPAGMQAFWFNTRRDKFADRRVREALNYLFDFEWSNENLFYNTYTRTTSYFANSELASSGLPQGLELEILEPFRGRVPDEVFSEVFTVPQTDGSGTIPRENLRAARELLAAAGWEVQDQKLTNTASGEVMQLEFLLISPSFERVVAPVIQNMERLGIEATMRTVDTSQYVNRLDSFDYDIIVTTQRQSVSPGNEQRDDWTTEYADTPGSSNWAGVRDPVVDELVELVISAPDRETLIATTRALDRVLLWGHYTIPHWNIPGFRIVYWNKFSRPELLPSLSHGFPTIWWVDEAKLARLEAER